MVDDEVEKGSSCGEMPDEEIDEALAESFPVSDPPSWTLGIDDHCKGGNQTRPNRERNRFGKSHVPHLSTIKPITTLPAAEREQTKTIIRGGTV